MADVHLDHPGDVTWLVGRGPAPIIGPCPHDCEHHLMAVIAWGPDYDHYTLLKCDAVCAGECRGWTQEWPYNSGKPKFRDPQTWLQVDLSQEQPTSREASYVD